MPAPSKRAIFFIMCHFFALLHTFLFSILHIRQCFVQNICDFEKYFRYLHHQIKHTINNYETFCKLFQ